MHTPIRIPNLVLLLIFVIFSCSLAAYADDQDQHEYFLKCLTKKSKNRTSISSIVYSPGNPLYKSIFQFSIQNQRFAWNSTTPKPLVIITPEDECQIPPPPPPVIYCAKENNLQIRTRSGGHDLEGLSYISYSHAPFILLDLIKFTEIKVDAEHKTAWVESGATVGQLYYEIAQKSPTLGFPAGNCPTVGVGGHFSGGGYGTLMRKYGLAADNVIDARIIDVNGRILDRKSMGEDLFWAIRGGGSGGSFGVIVAWNVLLVDVPKRVTLFTIERTLEQNATQLVNRWQYIAHSFDKDLYMVVGIRRVNGTILATFSSVFLGGAKRLLTYMQANFPELGVVREDCTEMSWVESTLSFWGYPIESPKFLLNRTDPTARRSFKAKSDYVQKPIPEYELEGIWRLFYELEADKARIVLVPLGGRMDEISESATPFPHRAGNLYEIMYVVYWRDEAASNSDKYINWIRRFYSYMTPYVSRCPRAAYANYRDLDIGVNNKEGKTSYEQARVWGLKYFKNNFDRLVRVKTVIDPQNFFRNEQSIPPLSLLKDDKERGLAS